MPSPIPSFVLRHVKLADETPHDLVVREGKVNQICAPGTGQAQHVVNLQGRYVSSGWIDWHVHAFEAWQPYGDRLDEIGVNQGVTTVVDAGSCGADRITDLFNAGATAKTNLYALLNVSRIGLARMDELSDLAWLDPEAAKQAVAMHRQRIVGLKARISQSVVGNNGIKPLLIARQMARELALPLMVHVGSAPPHIDAVLALLEQGDIITHYLHGKSNSLFSPDGAPRPALIHALRRGVQLDVGHGSASFSFRTAEAARAHGIPLGTISTDIYRSNRLNGPVYSLATVLTKFLHLGYPLPEVIASVTTHAATRLGKFQLGRIVPGEPANLTLFSVVDEPLALVDSEGAQRRTERHIRVEGVVVNGEYLAL